MAMSKPTVREFEAFRRNFHWSWDADPGEISEIKCLRNALLSLYFFSYISAETLQRLHSPRFNAALWERLTSASRISMDTASLGDIAVQDDTAHACIVLEVWADCYRYSEYHSSSCRLCSKISWCRRRDEFIAITDVAVLVHDLLFEAAVDLQYSGLYIPRKCRIACEAISEYCEEGNVYCSCQSGDTVWQLSLVYPSHLENKCWYGYVWVFNYTAMHVRSPVHARHDADAFCGYMPISVLRRSD